MFPVAGIYVDKKHNIIEIMDERAKELEKLTNLTKTVQKMRTNLILSTIKSNRYKSIIYNTTL